MKSENIILKHILENLGQFPCKLYPILDQTSLISIPYSSSKLLFEKPTLQNDTYVSYSLYMYMGVPHFGTATWLHT